MVGRYTGREFNNHVNSVTGMCGLFWMRPPFLGPSSIADSKAEAETKISSDSSLYED
jgi:hypothetical protein